MEQTKTPKRDERLDCLGIRAPHPQGLTEGILQKAQTVPLGERYTITDAGGRGAVPGLYIRVGAARPGPKGAVPGPVTYYCQARVKGTLRQFRLGPAAMGLDRARELASEVIGKAAGGVSVTEEREAERVKGLTFLDYATGAYKPHLDGLKRGEAQMRIIKLLLSYTTASGKPIGDIPLNALTARDLDDVLQARKAQKRAPGTLHRDWRSLCACLRQAWKDDALKVLPFKEPPPALKGQRPAKRTLWLGKDDPAQVKRFERALAQEEDEPVKVALQLLILTGMRRNELLGLALAEVSWTRGVATVPPERSKTGRERVVHLNVEAQSLLKSLKVRDLETGAFFPGAMESYAWEERLRAGWERIRRRARVPDLKMQDLRHTFAARMRLTGASLEVVRDALGHSTIAMTERYSNIGSDEIAKAVARVRVIP